jgi:hypothetical protein
LILISLVAVEAESVVLEEEVAAVEDVNAEYHRRHPC